MSEVPLSCCARFQLGTRVGASFSSRHTRVPTVPSWLPPFFAVLHIGRSLEVPALGLCRRRDHSSGCRAQVASEADWCALAWDVRHCVSAPRTAQGARPRSSFHSGWIKLDGRPAHGWLADATAFRCKNAEPP